MSSYIRLLAGICLALASKAQAVEPFFFIQGSDPQFGFCESRQRIGNGFAQDTANFEFVIATVNRLRPAFLIVTGDLVNRQGDPAQTAEYFRVAGKLDPSIHLYNVAGNHDVLNEPTPASLATYRRQFGPNYYTFRVGGMAAFVLNSPIIAHPKNVPDEFANQEAWLRRELAKAKHDGMRDLVVFQHHLLFVNSPDEKDTYYTLPLEQRRRYLNLFTEYGVSHVFSGHYHRNAAASYGPLKLTTTTAITCADTQSGIRIVTVKGTGIESQAYDFGVLPTRVDLNK
ncbi:MAG: metallophosphoesterase [Bryobacteraceae bacterium]